MIVAVVAFLAALAALGGAVFFQLGTWTPAPQKPLPPEYVASNDSLNLATVDAHFQPPTNVRFVVTSGTVTSPLNGNEILGYFDADSASGLAAYPDDFSILGGRDASLFSRAIASYSLRRAGLQATPELAAQLNKMLSGLTAERRATYEIRVVGRDVFGNLSEPTTVRFDLVLAPAGTVTTTAVRQITSLEALAREIALVIDPQRTPRFFEAYRRAMRVPAQCGANGNDAIFVTNYRRAFEHERERLTASNIEALYGGVCAGWKEILDKQTEAEAARQAVASENAGIRLAAEIARRGAAIARNTSLTVAAAAFMFFMWISLSLAFLAIESHTRAMRDAMKDGSKRGQ